MGESSIKGKVDVEAAGKTWTVFLGNAQWGELENVLKVKGYLAVEDAMKACGAGEFAKVMKIALSAHHASDIAWPSADLKAQASDKPTLSDLLDDIGHDDWLVALITSWKFHSSGPNGRRLYELQIRTLDKAQKTALAALEAGKSVKEIMEALGSMSGEGAESGSEEKKDQGPEEAPPQT